MLTIFLLRILLYTFVIEPEYSPYFYYLNLTSLSLLNVGGGGPQSLSILSGNVVENYRNDKINKDYLNTLIFSSSSSSSSSKNTIKMNTVSSSSVKTWNEFLSQQNQIGLNLLDDFGNGKDDEMCNSPYHKVCSIYEYDLNHHLLNMNENERNKFIKEPVLLSSGTFKDISESIENTKNNIIMNIHGGEPFGLCVNFFESMINNEQGGGGEIVEDKSTKKGGNKKRSSTSSPLAIFNIEIYNFYKKYIEEFNIKTMYDILLHTNAHSLLLIEHRVKRIFKSEYIIDFDLNNDLITNVLLPLLTAPFNSTSIDPDFHNFIFDSIYDLMKSYLISFNEDDTFKMMKDISSPTFKFSEKDCLDKNDNGGITYDGLVECIYYNTIQDLELENYDCLVKKLRELWNVNDDDLISFNNYEVKIFENMFCLSMNLNTTIFLLSLDYLFPLYTFKNNNYNNNAMNKINSNSIQQKYNSLIKKQRLILEKTKVTFSNVNKLNNINKELKNKILKRNIDEDNKEENLFTFHSRNSAILKGLLNFSHSSSNDDIIKKCRKTIRELFHYTFNYRYMELSVTSNNQCENVFDLIKKYVNISKMFFTPGEFNNLYLKNFDKQSKDEDKLFSKNEIEDISLRKQANLENIEQNQKLYVYLQEKMENLMIIVMNCIDNNYAKIQSREENDLKDELNISKIESNKMKWLLFFHLHRFSYIDKIIDQFVKTTHRFDYLTERKNKILNNKHISFPSSSSPQQPTVPLVPDKILQWIWTTTEVEIVNAWYTPSMNMITIPLGIVEYPLFRNDPNYDQTLLGNIIGHEIGHASDHHGILFDKNGDFTDRFLNHTNEAEKCMIEDFPKKICNFNNYGSHTLSENMADQFGLRMSLVLLYQRLSNAYSSSSSSSISKNINDTNRNDHNNNDNADDELKQNFIDSNIKLYKHRKNILQKELFINFIKIWCGRTTLKRECSLVNNDVHALARHRVTNTLRNFKTYKQLFECNDEDFLVNPKPCMIY